MYQTSLFHSQASLSLPWVRYMYRETPPAQAVIYAFSMWWEPSLLHQSKEPWAAPLPASPLPFHSLPSSHSNFPSWWSFWWFSCPRPTWRPSLFFLLISLGCTHFHGLGCCPFSVSSILIFLEPTSPLTDSQPCSWSKELAITVSSTRPLHSSACSGLLLPPFLWNCSVIDLMAKSRDFFNPHLICSPQHLTVLFPFHLSCLAPISVTIPSL